MVEEPRKLVSVGPSHGFGVNVAFCEKKYLRNVKFSCRIGIAEEQLLRFFVVSILVGLKF